ncbi:protein transport protein S31 [Rhizina undulata]
MARIRDIQRTAAFAWSPETSPFIATGTQAGAVSADFSDNTKLELWDLDLDNAQAGEELSPVTSIDTDSKFYDIAWGRVLNDKPRGIIAGGLENGSLDLWSADALLDKSGDPRIARTTKHTGAIKSLQFNPFKSELLATAGAKGELYVWDLNNVANPFMLGNRAARADDFDCVDWNKKVPHILVTGGNGGFLTVWDVKAKRESLTLHNLGRKAVSAVAWHPEHQTKLITAIPDDTNPVILLWDLRNSNAPERTLTGHQAGVLSLSWCQQDPDLLLSCGKDSRTICWNPQTGEMLGEFPVVTNWTFKTRWNPRNPDLSATASYDGKIVIQTLQNTNPDTSQPDTSGTVALDGDDFFSRASNAQPSSFSLKQAPKWLQRPVGASFGFGGKLVSFTTAEAPAGQPRKSKVKISTFAVESGVNKATENFEQALKEGNLVNLCDQRVEDANTEDEKAEWKILRTLFEQNSRDKLIEYLGFKAEAEETIEKPVIGDNTEAKENEEAVNGSPTGSDKRLSSFFADSGAESFLADLSSIQPTRGARTNNPFQIFNGEESEADKKITRALVLGQFDQAVDVCLKEDRMSDAFMLAVCGGEKCIEKVKTAYFTKKANGPSYLRVLASIVGKNLWDVVYNADLGNWNEVMVALCTFADKKDFPDLCEALGDRLEDELRKGEDNRELRKNAAFCYLAGSKLEKVVNIWIEELKEGEKAGLEETSGDSIFGVHVRSLQNFIEKVTIFREAVKFVDDEKGLSSGWKLNALYEKYCEYADVVASHGQLDIAAKYLDLLPLEYPAATVARNRVKEASGKGAPVATQTRKTQQPVTGAYGGRQSTGSPYQPIQPTQQAPVVANPYAPQAPAATLANPYVPSTPAALANPYAPPNAIPTTNPYAPPTATPGANPYAPPGATQGYRANMYQPTQPAQMSTGPYGGAYSGYNPPTGFAQPPRQTSPVKSVPPHSKTTTMTNWNDTPDVVKMPRRSTPAAAPAPVTSPFPGAPTSTIPSPPQTGLPYGVPPPPRGGTAPPPPPPKNAAPPQRVQSPAQHYQPAPPAAQTTGPYAPVQQTPYGAATGGASGRYTPVSGATGAIPPPPQGAFAGRMTAPPQAPQYALPPSTFGQPPAPSPYGSAPPQATPGPYGPPPTNQPPISRSSIQQSEIAPPPNTQTPVPQSTKHPAGDRTHIPAQYKPIYELLSAVMDKVKQHAPPGLERQVKDTEKRLNILYDHINNEELLSPEALESMLTLSRAIASNDYGTAHNIQVDLVTHKTAECNMWMPGVKRLIEMSRLAQ